MDLWLFKVADPRDKLGVDSKLFCQLEEKVKSMWIWLIDWKFLIIFPLKADLNFKQPKDFILTF